jgi:Baculovirus polyhedron envelope protein, PEP, C terminus/Baculovirus polyhedron envelope protein, PEP, N terminus
MSVISKKIHDIGVTVYVDPSWVLWLSAEDVLHLLKLPLSLLQTIPPRHKRCWIDLKCPTVYRFDNSKIFIDLYGLAILCNRVSSNACDYLMTQFIAEVYRDFSALCNPRISSRRRSSRRVSRRRSSRCRSPIRRRSSCRRSRRRSSRRRSSCRHHHHLLLDRIAKQNDTIINNLNQLTLTSSNQHLELQNLLNTIRLQNVTIINQTTQILSILETQLGEINNKLTQLISDLETRLEALAASLIATINQLTDNLRNDLTTINSILNNLTSSVTNINSTLNNLIQAINNLKVDDLLSTLLTQINRVLELLQQVLGILQPGEILIKK